jgi:MFS family permease
MEQDTVISGKKESKLFYGYIIVAASVAIQIIAFGMYNSYGVYFDSLLTEFQWSSAAISGALSIASVMLGIGAMLWGHLSDRFSPRVLMSICGVFAGVAYLLLAHLNSIWQLYLFFGIIMALGISGTDVILLSTTARWFMKRRATMSGVVKIGTGAGMLIMPLVSVWLISSYGWRDSYTIIGIVLLVSVVGASQFLRRNPASMGLFPDGAKVEQKVKAHAGEAGLSVREAMRTSHFWFLSIAYFMVFFCSMSIIVHISEYVLGLGISATLAASMVSIIGGMSIVGRLVMGVTADKIGSGRTLFVSFIILVVSLVWLQAANVLWTLVLFAVVYGFSHGNFYSLVAPAVADYFGTRAHGSILGIVFFFGALGGGLGPLISGHIFDLTSDYRSVFLMLIAVAIIGTIMAFALGGKKNHFRAGN